mgnify:CR=1 FL=1
MPCGWPICATVTLTALLGISVDGAAALAVVDGVGGGKSSGIAGIAPAPVPESIAAGCPVVDAPGSGWVGVVSGVAASGAVPCGESVAGNVGGVAASCDEVEDASGVLGAVLFIGAPSVAAGATNGGAPVCGSCAGTVRVSTHNASNAWQVMIVILLMQRCPRLSSGALLPHADDGFHGGISR